MFVKKKTTRPFYVALAELFAIYSGNKMAKNHICRLKSAVLIDHVLLWMIPTTHTRTALSTIF